MVFSFKCIHKLIGCSLNDIGLSLVEGRTRDAGARFSVITRQLKRHHYSKIECVGHGTRCL